MEQGVPKHRHLKFRSQGITQKKAYKLSFPVIFTSAASGPTRESQGSDPLLLGTYVPAEMFCISQDVIRSLYCDFKPR